MRNCRHFLFQSSKHLSLFGCNHWVEGTTLNSFAVHDLKEIFTFTQCIHIVRPYFLEQIPACDFQGQPLRSGIYYRTVKIQRSRRAVLGPKEEVTVVGLGRGGPGPLANEIRERINSG